LPSKHRTYNEKNNQKLKKRTSHTLRREKKTLFVKSFSEGDYHLFYGKINLINFSVSTYFHIEHIVNMLGKNLKTLPTECTVQTNMTFPIFIYLCVCVCVFLFENYFFDAFIRASICDTHINYWRFNSFLILYVFTYEQKIV
jgi:hypothetical protein